MIVDTHCHAAAHWYEPAEALLARMDACGVARAWLVQLLNAYDNAYQQAQAAAHPDRFVSIVGVDWTRADAAEALHRLADAGARGVRLRPGSRSPGDDPLAIWRVAAERALVVSCVGTAAQFAEAAFAELLGALPGLPVVLEHLGGLGRPDAGDVAKAKAPVLALARFADVRLKLPGLGQLLPRPALEPPPREVPLIDEVIAAFGAERVMWASDFPVVSSREGYANALGWVSAVLPDGARDAILGGAAARLIG